MNGSRLTMLMLVLGAAGCMACTSSVGSVVRDVRYAPDGRLIVERCDLVLTYAAFQYVPDPTLENCTTHSAQAPQPRSSE